MKFKCIECLLESRLKLQGIEFILELKERSPTKPLPCELRLRWKSLAVKRKDKFSVQPKVIANF